LIYCSERGLEIRVWALMICGGALTRCLRIPLSQVSDSYHRRIRYFFRSCPIGPQKNWDSHRRGSGLTTTLMVFMCAVGSPIFCSSVVVGLRQRPHWSIFEVSVGVLPVFGPKNTFKSGCIRTFFSSIMQIHSFMCYDNAKGIAVRPEE